MAEALPSVVAKEMLRKVLCLASDEVSLAWGFKDELRRLEKSLEMVQALLSENKKSQLKAVQLWLNNLNVVAYDADAALDEFTYETLRRKVENRKREKVRALFSPSKNPLSFRLKMARKIRNINESLDEIYKEGTKIGLIKLVGAADTIVEHKEIRLTHPYVDDSEVVGRDDDVSKIADMLLCCSDNEKYLSVMAIVGMGGQGKTTLAQLVCKHDKVVRHFDKTIWVCVSDDFKVERLLNEMVQSLTRTNSQLSNVEAIIKNLGEILQGKRYLLVLDDVWNEDEDKWDCMRKALLGISASSGSKIMVTTRSDQVISSMQASLTHRLRRLSDEDSWTMFKQRAFAEGGAVETNNLVVIGREIVKRCGGLPLAIKALGGLMYSKKSEAEWRSIQSSQLWDLEDKTGRVLPTLELSYEYLPSSLKHCFALCSIFPKDFYLEKSNLIQLWMALDLLCPPKSSDLLMECIGNKYFNTLFLNSLLQDAEKDEYDYITRCKMHDIVHDLALKKSDNYCSTLEACQLNGDSDVVHLSLISSLIEISENSKKICSRLQTLILKGGLDGKLLANFKCLRVLVLDHDSITELPDSIEKLKHLRYLDISKTNIFSPPNSVTKLYHLQTLRLKWVCKVPNNFANLINLRHFCIDDISQSADCKLFGIGRLTYLQTLPFFVVNRDRGCHIKELGSLKNLRGDLTIFGLEQVENSGEAKHAYLSKKSHLRALRLCWAVRDDRSKNKACIDEHVLESLEPHSNLEGLTVENFVGGKFPSWMMAESQVSPILRNLVKFKLENCNECERIPPLGHLRHLKVVEIIGMNNVKVIGTEFYGKHTGGGGANSSSGAAEVPIFPALRELTLEKMPKLERWSEAVQQQSGSMNVFPCLEKLKIKRCSSLTSLPHLGTTLEELDVTHCPAMVSFPDFRHLRELCLFGISEENDYFPWPSTSAYDAVENADDDDDIEALSFDDGIQCLQYVMLRGWPRLKSLPEQLQHLSALTSLSLWSFDGLESLPEWLGNLSSLRSLCIFRCENVKYMPSVEAMRRLTNLSQLEIWKCPLLEERCTQDSGPEWEKISHITRISINLRVIKK